MNILNVIAARKRTEVEAAKALLPEGLMRDIAAEVRRAPISLRHSITTTPGGVIAEFKRRSPSRGEIHPLADVQETVGIYQEGGAAACSVLTDTPFFGGSLTDLDVARSAVEIPLLRKDFTIDAYQLMQARVHGADAVLLIASLLDYHQVGTLTEQAHDLGLEVLLELHTPDETDRYFSEIDLVGVNSRNLSNFVTDLDVAARMIDALPAEAVKIAESGIHSREDMLRLKAVGYDGFLIGELLMSSPDPAAALKALLQ